MYVEYWGGERITWELSENVNTRLFPGPIQLTSQMGTWASRLSLEGSQVIGMHSLGCELLD